jgi:6-phosphogluconolactonase (cycloisomerase 2 family)
VPGLQYTGFVFGPFDSDQDLVVDPARRLLFAVNSGSDTIAVLNINSDGSLSAIPGSPFPSGGTNPVSLGLSGDLLFVVNKNGDFARMSSLQPNYTAFRIGLDGSLSPVDNSTINVAFNSSPAQALVAPNSHLFGADFLGGLLQSFTFDDGGHLVQQPPIALPANGDLPLINFYGTPLQLANFPLGLWTHPRLPLFYVGFSVINQLGVYSFDQDGRLEFLRSVPNSAIAICWVRVNRSGTRLYTGNNGISGNPATDAFSTVSVYDLTDPATPAEIQTLQIKGVGNVTQIGLSSDEKYLYVISQRNTPVIPPGQGNALHIFTILRNGTLSEQIAPIVFQPPQVPAGSLPQGVAVYSPDQR